MRLITEKNKNEIGKRLSAIYYITVHGFGKGQKTDLESMAKHFNYSPQYISKKIKSCSGTTFSGIVKQIRYGQAKKMLANTQMSVREISNALGYMNAENFTRSFKAMSGMSPKEYKKSLSSK